MPPVSTQPKPTTSGPASAGSLLCGSAATPAGARQLLVRPTGQLTPVPPTPQYPPGFFARYCWW